MKHLLNVVIVGYNEEKNLPKLFLSLDQLKKESLELRVIYVDQTSSDKSLHIAKEWGAETYLHPNLGYADPDKERAFETLISKDSWCLLLDCDETLDHTLIKEISRVLHSSARVGVYMVYRTQTFLGKVITGKRDPIFFYSSCMKVKRTIHNLFAYDLSHVIGFLSGTMIGHNLKDYTQDIQHLMSKINRYTDIELTEKKRLLNQNTSFLFVKMLFLPIVWFFGMGIRQKLFFKGKTGWIYCIWSAITIFVFYSKLYEKKIVK